MDGEKADKPTICIECRWHCWRKVGFDLRAHACCCPPFTRTCFITGNTQLAECDTHNYEGRCGGFEIKPPDQPQPRLKSWFERLFC